MSGFIQDDNDKRWKKEHPSTEKLIIEIDDYPLHDDKILNKIKDYMTENKIESIILYVQKNELAVQLRVLERKEKNSVIVSD